MKAKQVYSQLEKIWILRLLVSSGSFKETARTAGVSSPAISQTVAALERFFGKSLIVRERGHAHGTPFCKLLIKTTTPAFEALDSLHFADDAQSLTISRLKLGSYESLAVGLLPSLLPALNRRHPGLKLEVRTARSGALAAMVRQGDLDLALVTENDLIRNLQSVELAFDGLGLYVSPGHEIFRRGFPHLEEFQLGGLTSGKDGLPLYYKKFTKSIGARFAANLECDSFETLRALAVAGLAVCILPHRVAHRDPGRLTQVLPASGAKLDSGRHAICLISRKGVDEAARALVCRELILILKADPTR